MRHRLALVSFALAAALAVAGCSDSTAPVPGGGTTHTVTIENSVFTPATLTIAAGDKVQWKNKDSTPHTATSDNGGAINTGSLSLNATSNAVTFSGAATFRYHCAFHQNMTGTIIVN